MGLDGPGVAGPVEAIPMPNFSMISTTITRSRLRMVWPAFELSRLAGHLRIANCARDLLSQADDGQHAHHDYPARYDCSLSSRGR